MLARSAGVLYITSVDNDVTNRETLPPPSSGERPTVPVPPERCEEHARAVYEHCRGLSFGAALAASLYEKGNVL